MKIKATINKLKRLNNQTLSFMKRYIAQIAGIIAGIAVLTLVLSIANIYKTTKPVNTEDYASTSVKLLNLSETSGGSGVILRSNLIFSEILTNKHVCRLLEGGGIVIKDNRKNLVAAIKKYPTHDLCLVKVFTNYGVNTEVISTDLKPFDDAFISGHPSLFPHVLSKGNFSGKEVINLVVGLKKCKKKDFRGKYGLYCMFFGVIPIVQSFEATLVTGTILPGSSGSGVFNSDGEIAGLVFAGNSKSLSYAFIVPHEYILDFLEVEDSINYVPVSRTAYDDLIQRVFKFNNQCPNKTRNNKRMGVFCKNIENYMIWEK